MLNVTTAVTSYNLIPPPPPSPWRIWYKCLRRPFHMRPDKGFQNSVHTASWGRWKAPLVWTDGQHGDNNDAFTHASGVVWTWSSARTLMFGWRAIHTSAQDKSWIILSYYTKWRQMDIDGYIFIVHKVETCLRLHRTSGLRFSFRFSFER